ncbi:hypothetical protein P8C59_000441 [Phyllachora maydis]|uniref:PWI domain-containing protein n=1 Tax=Phyllachora maydis TaxID=1825666 RepID=A0AAD9M8U6_9PEZI|nr:hypothetical protein P8C59_000441 [Phyllachora maydis]
MPPPPAPSNMSLTAQNQASSAVSNLALFLRNLRLLDLDRHPDWPDITAPTFAPAGRAGSADAGLKRRVQCVEWALYQLFVLWDADEARNKLRPFFPPLDQVQSLNLRAALLRCLEQAKKNGVLGRDVVVRKTMLDECKGDRLEEVLAMLSSAVLKRAVAEGTLDGGGVRHPALAQTWALENRGYKGERTQLAVLALAHRASLKRLLKEKEAARAQFRDFAGLLDQKDRSIARRREQIKAAEQAARQTKNKRTVTEDEKREIRRIQMAEQILATMSATSPSPAKPSRHVLSLAERTRMSMFRRTSRARPRPNEHGDDDDDDEPDFDPLPLRKAPTVTVDRAAVDQDVEGDEQEEDLLARTRRSMAGFEAARQKAQLDRRRSQRKARQPSGVGTAGSEASTNHHFPTLEEQEEGNSMILAEELMNGTQDDYNAVFMTQHGFQSIRSARIRTTSGVRRLPRRERRAGHGASARSRSSTSGLPSSFQPPPNLPNINFNAPVIRLGGAMGTPSAKSGGPASDRRDPNTPTASHKPGLGMDRGGEHSRNQMRDSIQSFVPPTHEERLRTIFVHKIPEGVGGEEGIQKLLRVVGRMRRWDSGHSHLSDHKGALFGFAQYEDPESLASAVELLKDVEVPVQKQMAGLGPVKKDDSTSPVKAEGDTDMKEDDAGGESIKKEDGEDEYGGIEKVKLQVAVDELTLKYVESWKESRGADADVEARLQSARAALKDHVRQLFYPKAPAVDEGEVKGEGANGMGENVEVINIPLAQEDELADIPAEMREVVAAEIAAFRERSNQRDLERLRREEEFEEMERRQTRGVEFVNGGANGHRDDDDTDASDDELHRRETNKREAEEEKLYLEAERKWVNRERQRAAALDRERDRERNDMDDFARRKEEQMEREKKWDDEREATRKTHLYYRDHAAWARKRTADRDEEAARDEMDRRAEEDERRRQQSQMEQARGMADSFLEREAEEMERRDAAAATAATAAAAAAAEVAAAPAVPQRFTISFGAAAQKAQANRSAPARRTIAEVEGLLDDEEQEQTTKRQLVPIKFEPLADTKAMTEEEVQKALRSLAQEIPTEKDGLWAWEVKWDFLDESVVQEKLRPFVEKKIMEYLGVQEQFLVEMVEKHVGSHGKPQELVETLAEALDEDAEDLVKKLWRMLNAIPAQQHAAMDALFRWYDAEPSLRCAVLTGAGRAFCAGADLKEWNDRAAASSSSSSSSSSSPAAAMPDGGGGFGGVSNRAGKKPIVAAVNGLCLGGGMEMAVNCDVVLAAAAAARFGLPEARRGVVAGAGALPRLVRTVGRQRAAEMALLGRSTYSAAEMERWGLVNRVVPAGGDVVAEAVRWAAEVAANSPDSVVVSREGLRLGWEGLGPVLGTELLGKGMYGRMDGAENMKEGLRSFVEKRKPVWSDSKL